jgi:hypothetical protein
VIRFHAGPVARTARATGLGAFVIAILASVVAAQPPGPAVVASGDRSLRVLVAQASAVVLADAASTESFDEDRLRSTGAASRAFSADGSTSRPGIVEMRGATKAPPSSWTASMQSSFSVRRRSSAI